MNYAFNIVCKPDTASEIGRFLTTNSVCDAWEIEQHKCGSTIFHTDSAADAESVKKEWGA